MQNIDRLDPFPPSEALQGNRAYYVSQKIEAVTGLYPSNKVGYGLLTLRLNHQNGDPSYMDDHYPKFMAVHFTDGGIWVASLFRGNNSDYYVRAKGTGSITTLIKIGEIMGLNSNLDMIKPGSAVGQIINTAMTRFTTPDEPAGPVYGRRMYPLAV